MKKLTSLFASILLASTFISAPVSAVNSQSTVLTQDNNTVLHSSGGGRYHQCFLEGKPGCK